MLTSNNISSKFRCSVRTALALGISEKKVREIVRIGDSLKPGEVFETPGKVRTRAKPKREIDDDVKSSIREIIYGYCASRKY